MHNSPMFKVNKAVMGAIFVMSTVGVHLPAVAQSTANYQAHTAVNVLSDTKLQAKVSINAGSASLTEILKDLSMQAHVSLVAAEPDREQRMTICLPKTSLAVAMLNISDALSHNNPGPERWLWETRLNKVGASTYLLSRSRQFLAYEAKERDYPRKQAAMLLHKVYAAATEVLTNRDSLALKSLPSIYINWFTSPETSIFCDALRSLNAGQIEQLADFAAVPLQNGLFAEEVAAYNVDWREQRLQQQANALQNGLPDPFPAGVPAAPDAAPSIEFKVDDYNGELPDRVSMFGLWLNGVQTVKGGSLHLTFEPLKDSVLPLRLPKAVDSATVIDIGQAFVHAGVTGRNLRDCGKVLQALALASGRNIVLEQFYKCGYRCSPHPELTSVTYGTFEDVCNLICDSWDLQVVKKGDTYLFWSKTWALDRAADIPGHMIAKWRKQIETNQRLSLQERVEISKSLSWPQIAVTLRSWLPESGPWSFRGYLALKQMQ